MIHFKITVSIFKARLNT